MGAPNDGKRNNSPFKKQSSKTAIMFYPPNETSKKAMVIFIRGRIHITPLHSNFHKKKTTIDFFARYPRQIGLYCSPHEKCYNNRSQLRNGKELTMLQITFSEIRLRQNTESAKNSSILCL